MAIVVTRCFCTLTPYSMRRSLLNLEVSLRHILNRLTQASFWSNVPARFKMCLSVWLAATALWAGLHQLQQHLLNLFRTWLNHVETVVVGKIQAAPLLYLLRIHIYDNLFSEGLLCAPLLNVCVPNIGITPPPCKKLAETCGLLEGACCGKKSSVWSILIVNFHTFR